MPRGWDEVGPLQLGLVWAVLNMLGTLIALRACWNPPQSDPSPWLSLDHAAKVIDSGGLCHPCRITAISESSVELAFATKVPLLMHSSQLQWTAAVPPLPVLMVQVQERQAVLEWGDLSQHQRHSLISWLFCSDGIWPDRRPRQELLGLLMLLRRLLFGGLAPKAFDRSLVPRLP